MKCFHCGLLIEGNGIVISMDGDFVCDNKCEAGYEKDKAHFFNTVVHGEEATKNWLLGND